MMIDITVAGGHECNFGVPFSGSLRQVQVVLLMEPEPSSKASFCHVSLVESHLSSRLQQSFPVAFLFVKDVIKTSATSWSR